MMNMATMSKFSQ